MRPFCALLLTILLAGALHGACSETDASPAPVRVEQMAPPATTATTAPAAPWRHPPSSAGASEPTAEPIVAPAPRSAPVHVVAPGETIHAVAALHGTTAAALVFVNGLRGSRLTPGQALHLPDGDPRPPVPPFEPYADAVVVDRGVATRRSVALTFDAGADRGYAVLILNVLRDYGARASFGMTGQWARQNPDLVWRMAAEGHRLINHTWDHGSFTGFSTGTRALTAAERAAQLDRTDALLVELTGQSSRPFFRSPYGDVDATVQRDIAARGYAYNVLWTVDSGGWRGIPARSIIDICLRGARPGAIYVMHVGAAAQDGPALSAIVEGLAAAGYDFETIEEILM